MAQSSRSRTEHGTPGRQEHKERPTSKARHNKGPHQMLASDCGTRSRSNRVGKALNISKGWCECKEDKTGRALREDQGSHPSASQGGGRQ